MVAAIVAGLTREKPCEVGSIRMKSPDFAPVGVDNCPQEEAVALLYAQHWADSNASPDTEATRRLEQAYGAEKAKAINIILRMIRVGNLWGNSWDCFLYRISFGRWGE